MSIFPYFLPPFFQISMLFKNFYKYGQFLP